MRIQNNPTALNAHRNLTNNNSSISKSLEKLSSGYRINRAGDDAAGLAISEKMRAQIKGLETASKNANDGISLIQTAEGALTEVHSMLNRMVELSTQSANGTYTDSDRQKLQDEITALKDEVDRISTGTDFNGIKLLDGTLGASEGVTVGAKTAGTAAAAMTGGDISGAGTAGTSALSGTAAKGTVTFTIGATAATNQVYTLAGESFVIQAGDEEADSSLGTVIKLAGTASADFTADKVADALKNNETFKKAATDAGYDVATGTGATITLTEKTASDISVDRLQALMTGQTAPTSGSTTIELDRAKITSGSAVSIGGKSFEFVTNKSDATAGSIGILLTKDDTEATLALKLEEAVAQSGISFKATADTTNAGKVSVTSTDKSSVAKLMDSPTVASGSGLKLQVGDTNEGFQKVSVVVGSMDTKTLKIDDVDISTQAGAGKAVDSIKAAIESVSTTRGNLGALQNRLEHTINNLDVTNENMVSAESRIRDVDMAKEMMSYTKNNILIQASQAMLAQANQLPQGVLQLLQ